MNKEKEIKKIKMFYKIAIVLLIGVLVVFSVWIYADNKKYWEYKEAIELLNGITFNLTVEEWGYESINYTKICKARDLLLN